MCNSGNGLDISVVVPVYQGKKGLANTVNSLMDQQLPQDRYEIIIADNNSKDGTKETAMEFQKKHPHLIKVVHEDKIQSSYAARSKGAKAAIGNIVCFIDADMTVNPDYLFKVAQHFNDKELAYMGCRVQILGNKGTYTEKLNVRYGFPMQFYFEEHHFVGTGCLSVRRSVFDKLGYFDSRLESGGDREFGQRVYAARLKQHYDHDLAIYHPARWSYSSMINKEKRVTRGTVQLAHYYPNRYKNFDKRYFSIGRYIPLPNIKKLPKIFVSKQIRTTVYFFLLNYFYRLPILCIGLAECIKERHRFKKVAKTKISTDLKNQ